MTADHPSPSRGAGRKRLAVFVSSSDEGRLPAQVRPYLAALQPLTQALIVVCDDDLGPSELEKLAGLATHVITGRHGEYDFGSYKRGMSWARDNGLLAEVDDLILCNDSCFGPVRPLEEMFAAMAERDADFWGITASHDVAYHLQSYFLCFTRQVFESFDFLDFIEKVVVQPTASEVIQSYEVPLTELLQKAGFRCASLVEVDADLIKTGDRSYNDITHRPLYMIERGSPLVKVSALRHAQYNMDGCNRLLGWLAAHAPSVYDSAIDDLNIRSFEDAGLVAFSVLMPTYNRSRSIAPAINSILRQEHRNFELIVIDDGSTDDTAELIARLYPNEIADGRLRYVKLPENVGVCNARNIGASYARNPWVAYADSDNEARPYFLNMVANAITENKEADAFYGQIFLPRTGRTIGKPFERDGLVLGNFIDLGAFVHRRSLNARFGGFDPTLKRLVDWDLAIRYTRHKDPIFIPKVFVDYDDHDHGDRISVKSSFVSANVAVLAKSDLVPTVSTIIVSYNQQEFIAEAIESALAQKGHMAHEILISDDGSTDGTSRIIENYAAKHPRHVRNISRDRNFGVSENYRHCFAEAAGRYVAILEGDDYWIDPEKNLKQAEFLRSHPEATMVFSKVELFNMANGGYCELDRQNGLEPVLDGADFARDAHLNLIGNLSTLMIRRDLATRMPSAVFDPRLNEISLAFYMDRIGKIGFIDQVMSIYRLNSGSVWTGSSRRHRLEQAIEIRRTALRIAKAEHHAAIQASLDATKRQLQALSAQSERAADASVDA